jgi:hypothetical protein
VAEDRQVDAVRRCPGDDPGVSMIGGMAIPAEMDEGSFLGTLYVITSASAPSALTML